MNNYSYEEENNKEYLNKEYENNNKDEKTMNKTPLKNQYLDQMFDVLEEASDKKSKKNSGDKKI
jgi:hypothetical protein